MGCICGGTRHERRVNWRIYTYKGSYSAFNGYQFQPSDYSELLCVSCGRMWRTKAEYVQGLAFAEDARQRPTAQEAQDAD